MLYYIISLDSGHFFICQHSRYIGEKFIVNLIYLKGFHLGLYESFKTISLQEFEKLL